MSKTFTATLISSLTLIGVTVLQSTLLEFVAIGGVKPDLALVILVFVAVQGGSMVGQVSGFAAGLVQDFISVPPLGFFALIRAVIGGLFGRLQGSLLGGPVLLPLLLVGAATLLKGLLGWILGSVFGTGMGAEVFLGGRFWAELGYNGALAPVAFALLNRAGFLRDAQKERTG